MKRLPEQTYRKNEKLKYNIIKLKKKNQEKEKHIILILMSKFQTLKLIF